MLTSPPDTPKTESKFSEKKKVKKIMIVLHRSVSLTSRKVMRLGVSPTGGDPLQVKYATGLLPRALLAPMHTPIHAPPRLFSGREYASR